MSKSIHIDVEPSVAYDVDDTLIKWKDNITQPGEGKIKIIDPIDNQEDH